MHIAKALSQWADYEQELYDLAQLSTFKKLLVASKQI
jgi:hypothetical protein